jgi:hypothetical protein
MDGWMDEWMDASESRCSFQTATSAVFGLQSNFEEL